MKSHLVSALLVGVSICFGACAAQAANLYVAPSGANTNPGTQAAPLASPQLAVDRAQPGDTVIITAGVYDVGGGLRIENKLGTSALPITVQGQGSAILRDSRAQVAPWFGGLIIISGSRYITVRGLRLEQSAFFGIRGEKSSHVLVEGNTSYISGASAIYFRESNNITVRRNDVSRFCDKGAYGSGAGCQEGISIASVDTFDVAENIVHDAPQFPGVGPGGGEGIDAKESSRNGTIRYNRVYNLVQLGIYVDAWDGIAENIKIYGNWVYNNANGIVIASEQGGTARNIEVFNNVIYNNGLAGIAISSAGTDGPRSNIRIYHNTIVRNGYAAFKPAWAGVNSDWGQGINIDSTKLSGVLIANNILFDNSDGQIIPKAGIPTGALTIDRNVSFPAGKKSWAGEVLGTNPITTDPLFINQPAADFHLRAGSSAIASASSASPRPTEDAERKARASSGALDLGAFAFGGTAGVEVILDNPAAGVVDSTGARRAFGKWCASPAANKYGADSLQSCGSGLDTYRWTPTLPSAGRYSVYLWWGAQAANSKSVAVTVRYAGGSKALNFDQSTGGGRWVLHGTYPFLAGKGGFVQLNDANGQAVADAVRFVRVP